jgi:hypothetical protein
MPLKRIETKFKLLAHITKAIREARGAGVRNPVGIMKKVLDSKRNYRKFKNSIK